MQDSFLGVGRSTMDKYVAVVYRCSFLSTIHIDMITHIPTLTSRGALKPLECSCHIVVEDHSRVWEGSNHPETHRTPWLD